MWQTEEARAEAYHLMGVMNNLCTPKSGEILIAATQVRGAGGSVHTRCGKARAFTSLRSHPAGLLAAAPPSDAPLSPCTPSCPQDFLTSAFLLTSKDRFLTRPEISQLAAYMTDNKQVRGGCGGVRVVVVQLGRGWCTSWDPVAWQVWMQLEQGRIGRLGCATTRA